MIDQSREQKVREAPEARERLRRASYAAHFKLKPKSGSKVGYGGAVGAPAPGSYWKRTLRSSQLRLQDRSGGCNGEEIGPGAVKENSWISTPTTTIPEEG